MWNLICEDVSIIAGFNGVRERGFHFWRCAIADSDVYTS
jgi:hypothetical protein